MRFRKYLSLIGASLIGMFPGTLHAAETQHCSERPAENLQEHVIYIDKEGNLISPVNGQVIHDETVYVDKIITAAERFHAKNISGKPATLTIFVHGGLNSRNKAIERAREYTPCMLEDGHYPVFIGWSAGLFSNYPDHLFRLRRGKSRPLIGILTSPFVLAEDAARSVIRALPALYKEASDPFTLQHILNSDETGNDLVAHELAQLKNVSANLTITGHGVGSSYWSALNPIKLITAPLVDGFGKGTWDSLLRRTDFVLTAYESSHPSDPSDPNAADTAAAALLKRWSQKNVNMPVTLIGHSMGTIVVANILAKHSNMNVSNVVFMGAAAPLKSLENIVSPWLIQPAHANAEFYNLSLDPDRETSERNAWDFGPRGSLLNWIDEIFADINSFKDRTAGDWRNISRTAAEIFSSPEATPAAPIGKPLSKRVHLTRFGTTHGPQKHGDFDTFCFWRKSFWQGNTTHMTTFPACHAIPEPELGGTKAAE